jgi:hypothetical protein
VPDRHQTRDAVHFRSDRDGGDDRVRGMVERRAERIADRLEDVASVRFDLAAQDLVVALDGRLHRLSVQLPALRAAFDVREEERHQSRRRRRRALKRLRLGFAGHTEGFTCRRRIPVLHEIDRLRGL